MNKEDLKHDIPKLLIELALMEYLQGDLITLNSLNKRNKNKILKNWYTYNGIREDIGDRLYKLDIYPSYFKDVDMTDIEKELKIMITVIVNRLKSGVNY